MIEIIRRKISPGTLILTDMWRDYLGLEAICVDLGFQHQTVNHSEHFVDIDTGAHTQTIEGMWSVIRRIMRKDGTNHKDIMILVKINVSRFTLLFKTTFIEEMLDFVKYDNQRIFFSLNVFFRRVVGG